MSDEATKTRKLWGETEHAILSGKGIDIGCGPDPIKPDVRRFDIEDGDANVITQHVHEEFDFVFSSHCLEHMHEPRKAILEWWQLVKVGGHLIFIVPDEDLYEQGIFPSRFNPDHKATFTISKQKSWSPVSINVLDLARSLPNGELVSLYLQDQGYERRLMKHGRIGAGRIDRALLRWRDRIQRVTGKQITALDKRNELYTTYDQTTRPDALAQIQCIVKKVAPTR